MPLTDADIDLVRSEIGNASPPTDADLDAYLDTMGTVPGVALIVLRGRLSAMLASPAKLDVDGDVSVDWTANLKALQSQVDRLAAEHAGALADAAGTQSPPLVLGQLERTDRGR